MVLDEVAGLVFSIFHEIRRALPARHCDGQWAISLSDYRQESGCGDRAMNALRREIREMLKVEPREGGFGAVLVVDGKLSVFPDHFPDQAILPGICLVHSVLLAGAQSQGLEELRIRLLKNLKFMQAVRPG